MNSAYLITDSRYWLQAREQLDNNWVLIEADNPATNIKDWTWWVVGCTDDSEIGIDARLISYETATTLNTPSNPGTRSCTTPAEPRRSRLADKPPRSKEPIYSQPQEFTGMSAGEELAQLREWIRHQHPSMPSYSKAEPKPSPMQVATLVANLSAIGT